jgi:hypothetical protein
MMPRIFLGQGGAIRLGQRSAQSSKVEFEDEEEEEDEFEFVFPASPQLLKEGLCCSERRPLFRRVARNCIVASVTPDNSVPNATPTPTSFSSGGNSNRR